MIGPQTPRDAIRRAREYIEGVDTSRAIRASMAVSFAAIVILSMVPAVYADDVLDPGNDFFIDEGELIEDFETVDEWTHPGIAPDVVNDDDVSYENPRGEWFVSLDVSGGGADNMILEDPHFDGAYRDVTFWYRITNTNWDQEPTVNLDSPAGAEILQFNIYQGIDTHEWHRARLTLDWDNDTYSATVIDSNECEVRNVSNVNFSNSASSTEKFDIGLNIGNVPIQEDVMQMDYLYVNSTSDESACQNVIEGTVRDTNGNGLGDAVISFNNTNTTAISDSDGSYSVTIDQGVYNATASKTGFSSQTIGPIDVSGEGVTSSNNDFTLFNDTTLQIETDTHLCHGETTDYAVYELPRDTDERNDVTSTANVTSSNTDVLVVDKDLQQLNTTENINVNQVVDVTAEAKNGTVTKQVFVGNQTVENIDKFENSLEALVGLWGNVGCRGDTHGRDAPGGTQLTMLWIFASLSAAIVVTRFSTTFGGIGAFAVVMTMGWFIGGVGEGMIMLTWAFGIFLGLNVATNFQSFKR